MEENQTDKTDINSVQEATQNGGKRPGAGRPPGAVNEDTRMRQEKLNEIKNRIANAANSIVNAQLGMARGSSYLFHTKWITDKSGKMVKSTERVTDPDIIESYLNGEYDDLQDEFYYITTKSPNNFALDSLLNRAFGKPKETLEVQDRSQRKKIIVEIIDPRNGTGNIQTPSDDGLRQDMGSAEGSEDSDNS